MNGALEKPLSSRSLKSNSPTNLQNLLTFTIMTDKKSTPDKAQGQVGMTEQDRQSILDRARITENLGGKTHAAIASLTAERAQGQGETGNKTIMIPPSISDPTSNDPVHLDPRPPRSSEGRGVLKEWIISSSNLIPTEPVHLEPRPLKVIPKLDSKLRGVKFKKLFKRGGEELGDKENLSIATEDEAHFDS